jgi:hypothetical protein
MIDLCTSEAVQGSSTVDTAGLLLLLQKLLPLRPHCLVWAARWVLSQLSVCISRTLAHRADLL